MNQGNRTLKTWIRQVKEYTCLTQIRIKQKSKPQQLSIQKFNPNNVTNIEQFISHAVEQQTQRRRSRPNTTPYWDRKERKTRTKPYLQPQKDEQGEDINRISNYLQRQTQNQNGQTINQEGKYKSSGTRSAIG